MDDIQKTIENIVLKSIKSPPTFIRGTQMIQVPRKYFLELENYYKSLQNKIDDEDSKDDEDDSDEDDYQYPSMMIL